MPVTTTKATRLQCNVCGFESDARAEVVTLLRGLYALGWRWYAVKRTAEDRARGMLAATLVICPNCRKEGDDMPVPLREVTQ